MEKISLHGKISLIIKVDLPVKHENKNIHGKTYKKSSKNLNFLKNKKSYPIQKEPVVLNVLLKPALRYKSL